MHICVKKNFCTCQHLFGKSHVQIESHSELTPTNAP
jgi:hypothetical protein